MPTARLRKLRKILTYKQFTRGSQIGESLDLSWGSKIFEIGSPEHAISPIDWEMVDDNGKVAKYEFLLGDTEYLVQITRTPGYSRVKNVDVEFYANGDRDSVTNEGNPLKVMSTVITIVKDFLASNPEIGSFSFVPSMADYDDYRRLKLYLRYIKGHLDNPRITKEELGRGYLSITVHLNRPANESLTPHMKKSKFKVGQTVRAGSRIGKITSYRGGKYQVLIGSDHQSFLEKDLKSIISKK
jgi:hypothetical protein